MYKLESDVDSATHLLRLFKDLDAIKFSEPGKEFTLKSGRKSHFYLDCRLVTLDALGAHLLGELLMNSISDHLDSIASEENRVYIGSAGVGGAPLVGILLARAGLMGLPWQGFVVRDSEKDHGLNNLVEGHYGMDGHIILVEDVITSGSSVLNAAKTIESKDFKPVGVHCIIDREEGGRSALREAGLPLFSVLNIKNLLALENSDDPLHKGRCHRSS